MNNPKENPIILSENEVLSVLTGKEVQLRRLCDPQPPKWAIFSIMDVENYAVFFATDLDYSDQRAWPENAPLLCPFGARGDRLWVREDWSNSLHGDGYNRDGSEHVHECPLYRATMTYRCGKPRRLSDGEGIRWNSASSMPRWASRIALDPYGVTIEKRGKVWEWVALVKFTVEEK